MELSLQEAKTSDIPELLSMMSDFYSIDNYLFEREKTKRNLHKFIANDQLGKVWILLEENNIRGYIILCFGYSFEHGGRDAFIDEFYIKPDCRNQGLGGKTLKYINEKVKDFGVNKIHLEVEQHNVVGSALYRKMGFTDNGRILLSKKTK